MDQRLFKAVSTTAAVALTGIPSKEEEGKQLLKKHYGRRTDCSTVLLDYNKDFRAFLRLLAAPCSPFIKNVQGDE